MRSTQTCIVGCISWRRCAVEDSELVPGIRNIRPRWILLSRTSVPVRSLQDEQFVGVVGSMFPALLVASRTLCSRSPFFNKSGLSLKVQLGTTVQCTAWWVAAPNLQKSMAYGCIISHTMFNRPTSKVAHRTQHILSAKLLAALRQIVTGKRA